MSTALCRLDARPHQLHGPFRDLALGQRLKDSTGQIRAGFPSFHRFRGHWYRSNRRRHPAGVMGVEEMQTGQRLSRWGLFLEDMRVYDTMQ